MSLNLTFISPGGLRRDALRKIAGEPYSFWIESQENTQIALYDTFDWRLYEGGFWLSRAGGEIELWEIKTGGVIERLSTPEQPHFAWDFPEGRLKDLVKTPLDVRALLPLVAAESESQIFCILDDQRKTIARMALHRFQVGSGRSPRSRVAVAQIVPLKGYFRHARQLAKAFADSGLTPGRATDVFPLLLAPSGRFPRDYRSKPEYRLDPEMRAEEAARIILRHLLGVIRANEAGIREDIDTEFLHDFRVSIRRTRSALSQIRGVFPAEDVARFTDDFARLGEMTNKLRDLDVSLLRETLYRRMLPAALAPDIDPLFSNLKRERIQAHRDVARTLGTKKYTAVLEAWDIFLSPPEPGSRSARSREGARPAEPGTPNAWRPVIRLAKKRILKRYKRALEAGEEILATGKDEALHSLRIQCKKLRYLMEFFYSLFPPDPMDGLIRQLKRLQDNLGDFNDLTVQQNYLLERSTELSPGEPVPARTLLAIGALVGELEARKRKTKETFLEAFSAFAAPENRAIYQELFEEEADRRREDSG
ncbi:MAG TPA: CHAD domain-containing protein [Anaerolineales bacterium]|nr:CHAD domain-containing protein [Anaerolineales bacterium]